MSLFGTSPPDEAPSMNSSFARSRHGLFEEDANAKPASDSIFDDGSSSPWDMPSRKLKSQAEILQNLLINADVPEPYAVVFKSLIQDEESGQDVVTADGVARTLAASKLGADDKSKIMAIIAPEGSGDTTLSKDAFNVFLALIGLAQKGEAVSLDSVDEHQKKLPQVSLPGLVPTPTQDPILGNTGTRALSDPNTQPSTPPTTAPSTPLGGSKMSMEYPPEDPWNTPDVHKNHHHAKSVSGGPERGNTETLPSEASRAVPPSTFPTSDTSVINSGGNALPRPPAIDRRGPDPTQGWGGYGESPATSRGLYGAPGSTLLDGGHGSLPAQPPTARQTPRTTGSGQAGATVAENILVTLMPEKEGMFLFQHHNYEVTSTRRGSKVIRRYSDFVWLLECLHKRYPFRVLPLLPKKRVAVNGNHLSNDGAFIEKRRRGLARFLNALVRHPVLSMEQLVVMFMTVPTELSVWRKQAAISVQDEFAGRSMPLGLEESLSPQLQDLFDRTRAGVRRSSDLYITMCNVMDRLVKRNEGVANDHARLAVSLQSIIDVNSETYATDTNDVPLLNDGLVAMSKHLRTGQTLMDDEAKAWDEGVLEDLKQQRDALVGLRDLFDRRERLDRDNIPVLERRIQNNEKKLAGLRAKADLVKPGEIEKVVESIIKDKESIVNQYNRSIFVKECIRDELMYFQNTQYHVSRWNQDWAQERVKYSEMLADNWRRLLDELEGMPLGD